MITKEKILKDLGEIEILADHLIKLNDKQLTNEQRMYRGKGVRISLCTQHIKEYLTQPTTLDKVREIVKECKIFKTNGIITGVAHNENFNTDEIVDKIQQLFKEEQ